MYGRFFGWTPPNRAGLRSRRLGKLRLVALPATWQRCHYLFHLQKLYDGRQQGVASNGGKVTKGNFALGKYGFSALITDTEGNVVGLHSMR